MAKIQYFGFEENLRYIEESCKRNIVLQNQSTAAENQCQYRRINGYSGNGGVTGNVCRSCNGFWLIDSILVWVVVGLFSIRRVCRLCCIIRVILQLKPGESVAGNAKAAWL